MAGLKLELQKVIFLQISKEESVDRILKRGRKDDTKEALQERWEYFHEQVEPVIKHFRDQGRLVDVDGVGSVEDITQRIEQVL